MIALPHYEGGEEDVNNVKYIHIPIPVFNKQRDQLTYSQPEFGSRVGKTKFYFKAKLT